MMGVQGVGGQEEQDTQVIKDKARGAAGQIKALRDFMYNIQMQFLKGIPVGAFHVHVLDLLLAAKMFLTVSSDIS